MNVDKHDHVFNSLCLSHIALPTLPIYFETRTNSAVCLFKYIRNAFKRPQYTLQPSPTTLYTFYFAWILRAQCHSRFPMGAMLAKATQQMHTSIRLECSNTWHKVLGTNLVEYDDVNEKRLSDNPTSDIRIRRTENAAQSPSFKSFIFPSTRNAHTTRMLQIKLTSSVDV